ncbi:MAG TPA: hypothetical protein VK876_10645, partial [Rubrivivax sp.]|nr:hypothetical protein [Rubrivivax sp.]
PLPHQPLAAEPVALPPLQALPRGPLSVAQVPAGTGLAPGVPDAGPEGGRDVAAAPSAPASAPPRLNLELPRLRGGSLSQHGSPGVLELLPRPPERPSKLAREIEKTARDDCRQAYGGAGLLAVVPLLVDSVRQDGCKW